MNIYAGNLWRDISEAEKEIRSFNLNGQSKR